MTSLDACMIVEGCQEGDFLEAMAYLIKTGECWSLQGFYGRTAEDLIDHGYIDRKGNIIYSPKNTKREQQQK